MASTLYSLFKRLTTTSIGDADILIGDLAQLLVAIRTQAHIEVTREAASAFEKHQVLIKITLRFDSNLARGGAFVKAERQPRGNPFGICVESAAWFV